MNTDNKTTLAGGGELRLALADRIHTFAACFPAISTAGLGGLAGGPLPAMGDRGKHGAAARRRSVVAPTHSHRDAHRPNAALTRAASLPHSRAPPQQRAGPRAPPGYCDGRTGQLAPWRRVLRVSQGPGPRPRSGPSSTRVARLVSPPSTIRSLRAAHFASAVWQPRPTRSGAAIILRSRRPKPQ